MTGYSDADWAGDPVTRKSTSRPLCQVDQFLLTSECRGQETVALSRAESELCALVSIVSGVHFRTRDWTDTRESRQQRSGDETRSESQDETHSHEIRVQSRFGFQETAAISQD